MKRLISCLVLLGILLSGCGAEGSSQEESGNRYTATYLSVFDTVTTIVGFAESEEAFQAVVQPIHDQLLHYHQLFDIYNSYEGMVNLKTVNEQASIAPVAVDEQLFALIRDCKDFYKASGGKVNAAMGSVLTLWHEAREDGINDPANAYLPEEAKLLEAAEHVDFENVILDEQKRTVFFSDPLLKMDVGAIAKGWAVQKACENAPAGLLISVGGNICATGPKDDAGTPWVIGVQDPDGGEAYLHTLYLEKGSVVTSGDYQRAYVVDGEVYHHIIDPDTCYPANRWRSVSIVCEDSGIGDMLSTALFVLSQAEGQKLLDQYGAKAMWVDGQGEIFYSPGFEALIRT